MLSLGRKQWLRFIKTPVTDFYRKHFYPFTVQKSKLFLGNFSSRGHSYWNWNKKSKCLEKIFFNSIQNEIFLQSEMQIENNFSS